MVIISLVPRPFERNLKCVGATVIEFRLFNQITKKKKKEKNMDN